MAGPLMPLSDGEVSQLMGLSSDDRKARLDDRKKQLQDKIDAARREELANMPEPEKYLGLLVKLDFGNSSAIKGFLKSTQPVLESMAPVSLWKDSDATFYLLSTPGAPNLMPSDQKLPVDEMSKSQEHDQILQFLPTNVGVKSGSRFCDLRFGLALGTLAWSNANSSLIDSGYFVVINVVDKSLWIVLDFDAEDEVGGLMTDPESGVWGNLPNVNDMQIGALKIADKGWESGSIPGDPLSDKALNYNRPVACKMVADNAKRSDVQKALGGRGSNIGA